MVECEEILFRFMVDVPLFPRDLSMCVAWSRKFFTSSRRARNYVKRARRANGEMERLRFAVN